MDLDEINQFIEMTGDKMPEMLLPMQFVCSKGMRRIQLVRLKPNDYVQGRLTITSRKGARENGLAEISLTIELRDSVAKAVREHIKGLPKRSTILFLIFDDFDYTHGNERRKGKSNRTVEQRRGDKADRLFEKLVKGGRGAAPGGCGTPAVYDPASAGAGSGGGGRVWFGGADVVVWIG